MGDKNLVKKGKKTQFKKGHAKVGGKKKGYRHPKTLIRALGQLKAPKDIQEKAKELGFKETITYDQAVTISHLGRAINGDIQAIKLFYEYLAGEKLPAATTEFVGEFTIKFEENIKGW